jgi:transposase
MMHPDAAGVDVGNESHFAAVPPERDLQPIREFGCWTQDLERMGKWLKGCGIKTVALQSTGVYWIAVQEVLEAAGLEVFLVNARGTKNLPGRKSDVQECEWLRKLHSYGLLRNSFRPPLEIQAVRTVWRHRDRVVKEAGEAVQQMQKALTKMNVQLANVISDISGMTGMSIIRAIVGGQRDPQELAKLRDPRISASEEEIVRSLEGNWREDVLWELEQVLVAYDFQQGQLAACDKKLQAYLEALPEREMVARAVEAEPTDAKARKRCRAKQTHKSKKEPNFDLKGELRWKLGVDLTTIDGINALTAQTVFAELGADLSAFPDEDQFCSWLMLAPRRKVTGGRVIGHSRPRGQNRVANALRNAAQSLHGSETYLGARYRQYRSRMEGVVATKAMARYLACLIYRMLTKGQAWVDRGAVHYEGKRQERELKALHRRAANMGMRLVPSS